MQCYFKGLDTILKPFQSSYEGSAGDFLLIFNYLTTKHFFAFTYNTAELIVQKNWHHCIAFVKLLMQTHEIHDTKVLKGLKYDRFCSSRSNAAFHVLSTKEFLLYTRVYLFKVTLRSYEALYFSVRTGNGLFHEETGVSMEFVS